MMRYLLDSNVAIVFQKAGHLPELPAAAKRVPLAVVNDVLEELTLPKPGKPLTRDMKEAERVLSNDAIPLLNIFSSTPEEKVRDALRARRNAGKGEAASIAIAMNQPDLIFVTEDLKAMKGTAQLYRELPGEVGRIMGLHAFLRTLVEKSALAAAVAAAVSTAAKAQSNIDPPLWWEDWISTSPTAPEGEFS